MPLVVGSNPSAASYYACLIQLSEIVPNLFDSNNSRHQSIYSIFIISTTFDISYFRYYIVYLAFIFNDYILDIICFKNGEGKWLLANESDLKLFGLEGVDYLGKTDVDLAEYSEFHKEAFLTCKDTDEFAWKKRTQSRSVEVIPDTENNERTFDIIKIPLFRNDGRRKGLVVIGRDITESVRFSKEIQEQKRKIHETNIALRVLIDQEKEKIESLEQQIQGNIRSLVLPYIDKLYQVEMEDDGYEYLDLVSGNLESIVSSFVKSLDDPAIGLSPKELLVADLIRKGKNTSEISRLLGLTTRTVETYRSAIRKRLKINRKKINLQQYIQEKFS